jgi:hypothetical protein
MSVHKQHPINQDHRDHLCVENLDSRRIQPRWVEFNAFPLTATGSAESLLRMCLEDCFLWRWGSITGTVPSLRGLPSWLNNLLRTTLNDVSGCGLKTSGHTTLAAAGILFIRRGASFRVSCRHERFKRRKGFQQMHVQGES